MREYVGDEEFIVVNGDIYFEEEGVREFVVVFRREKVDVVFFVKYFEDLSYFGKIEVEGSFVKRVIEKFGKVFGYVNFGVYIFKLEVFGFIECIFLSERGEYEIMDIINLMIEVGKKVVYVVYFGYWNDIGRFWNFFELNEYFLKIKLKYEVRGIVEEGVVFILFVEIGEGIVIRSGVYIIGFVKIGKNLCIGLNCFIRFYISIGDNCYVGNVVEVKNFIIMDNFNVLYLNYVGDLIIGENCNFGVGIIIVNLRYDRGNIKVEIKGKFEDSGRYKFGVIIGYNVKMGINVIIYLGRKIGSGFFIGLGVIVDKNVFLRIFVVVK